MNHKNFSHGHFNENNRLKKRNTITRLLFAGFFSLTCVSQPTYSQELTPSDLYYFDGNRKIQLELEDGVVAEFGSPYNPNNKGAKSAIQTADSGATFVRSQGNLNLWKTSGKQMPVNLAKSLNQNQNQKSMVSPVFRTPKSASIMALPGNILVEFDPSYSEKQIELILSKKGLRSLRKFDLPGKNFYEVETPAGTAALNLANSLYGNPGVLTSSPNWWREAVAK